jgi:ribonuclease HII
MRKALLQLLEHTPHAPSTIVVDAMPLRLDNTHAQHIPVHYFNFGESFSSSIAAASIVAKVTRDRLMHSFDTIIPGFSLARNKGYATIHHRKALSEIHYSIIHRTRFVKTVLDKNNNETPL